MAKLKNQRWLNAGIVQKHFVQVVRAVEIAIGIHVPGFESTVMNLPVAANIEAALKSISVFDEEVSSVLVEASPIITKIATQLGIRGILGFSRPRKPNFPSEPLFTK